MFNKLKDQIINATQLALPNYEEPFIVTVDSGMQGMGACLSQIKEMKLRNGKTKNIETPIAFTSKSFNASESRSGSSERELFGLFYACKKWAHYLRHHPKTILIVDCQCLTNLKVGFEGKFARHHRIIEYLDGILNRHSAEIKYKKGKSNRLVAINALSRHSSITWEKLREMMMPLEEEIESPLCTTILKENAQKEGGDTASNQSSLLFPLIPFAGKQC